MTDEHPKAQAYERLYPGTGATESQKIERQERLDFKARKTETGKRSRYVSVPALPWKESAGEEGAARADDGR